MPALASEIFGLPHLAGNYALLSVRPTPAGPRPVLINGFVGRLDDADYLARKPTAVSLWWIPLGRTVVRADEKCCSVGFPPLGEAPGGACNLAVNRHSIAPVPSLVEPSCLHAGEMTRCRVLTVTGVPWVQMAPAVGAFALATKLVGWLYGRAAGPGGACHGHHCFRHAASCQHLSPSCQPPDLLTPVIESRCSTHQGADILLISQNVHMWYQPMLRKMTKHRCINLGAWARATWLIGCIHSGPCPR